MHKLPTAEEILDKQDYVNDRFEAGLYSNSSIEKAMIEFAKMHVKAALQAAIIKHNEAMAANEFYYFGPKNIEIIYPETLIK